MLDLVVARLGGVRETLRGLFFSPGFPRCAYHAQAAAASGTDVLTGDNPIRNGRVGGNPIRALTFVSGKPSAAGESLTVDIQRKAAGTGAFASILTAPYVFVAGNPAAIYDLTNLLVAGTVLTGADTLEVIRTYVAGGGPTMAENAVFVDYYGESQP